ncbi:MAG: hypothetical protein IJC16_03575 [Rikenellaceae bacterium]|nr:hypothetical protein [Rikenellaceae bacterium]
MKLYKFFAAAFAIALIASACSKEDGGPAPGGGGTPTHARIVLKFNLANYPTTYAMDEVDGSEHQNRVNIKEASVFLFNGNNTLAEARHFSALTNLVGGSGELFDGSDVTTNVTRVVIVGNAGDVTTGVTSVATLNDKIKSLADIATDYGASATGKIWVYGSASIPSTAWVTPSQEGDPMTAEVTVSEVNPVLARIDLSIDPTSAFGWKGGLTEAGGDQIDDAWISTTTKSYVILEGAAVLYSASYTHYIPTFTPTYAQIAAVASAPTTKALYSGLVPSASVFDNWEGTPHADADQFGAAGAETILAATWEGDWEKGGSQVDNVVANRFTRSFYALPPHSAYDGSTAAGPKANTIITVWATRYVYKEGTFVGTETLFWPVHFSSRDRYEVDGQQGNGIPLDNGMRYEVNVKLTKDLADPDDHKTENPEIPEPANVTVKVEQAKWKGVVVIDKEF